ncbi:hypothetical protein [Alicyclobacillus pomorum]|jgi:hypothetical protein|uniref:hypothetical protein n=1 Tax=Alicyclobacillus pomorum TaxID=204470 RepID=UPI000417309F|nr:hypothetical protein [Alicyclobacillus pomorum]
MKTSPRTPGYPFRYIAPEKLRNDATEFLRKFNAHGDGTPGIAVRTARPEDAERINTPGSQSPLK